MVIQRRTKLELYFLLTSENQIFLPGYLALLHAGTELISTACLTQNTPVSLCHFISLQFLLRLPKDNLDYQKIMQKAFVVLTV